MLGTCGAIGKRAQVILMWVRASGRWKHLPPTEIRSYEDQAYNIGWLMVFYSRMPKNTSIEGVGKKLWGFEWGVA